jgi:hypothetical protein
MGVNILGIFNIILSVGYYLGMKSSLIIDKQLFGVLGGVILVGLNILLASKNGRR